MKKLVMLEHELFFSFLFRVKECVDTCKDNPVGYFSHMSTDDYMFESDSYEEIGGFYALKDIIPYYFDEQEHDEDDNADGEQYVFSTDEMVEYYDLLEKLEKDGVISQEDHNKELMRMEDYIIEFICHTQGYGYDGVYCTMHYDAVYNQKYCISVLIWFDCSYSYFDLFRGLIMLFDRYEVRLQELKDKYCNLQLLEAA